jgi:bifunctional non-homologous end joining protein LigD
MSRKPRPLALHALAGAKRGSLPDFVQPCLATPVDRVPGGDGWVHEIKLDGYRLQARIDGGAIQLLTRTGLDWTPRFSAVARALTSLRARSALLDGEVVVGDAEGKSSFAELVASLKGGYSESMVYFAFDLLHLDGIDLTGARLLDRKALLSTLLRPPSKGSAIRYSEHLVGDGAQIMTEARKLGLEGIISKRGAAPYRSGRRDDWRKTKVSHVDEFVVGGYLDSTVNKQALGALVVGFYERGQFIYAGRVGTGFDRRSAHELWIQLRPLRIAAPAFSQRLDATQRRDVTWVRPEIVVQVEYRAWTADDLLRHASFKGLRDDKPAVDVRRPKTKRLVLHDS